MEIEIGENGAYQKKTVKEVRLFFSLVYKTRAHYYSFLQTGSIVMAFLCLLLTLPTSLHHGCFPVIIAKATLITAAQFTWKIANISPNTQS